MSKIKPSGLYNRYDTFCEKCGCIESKNLLLREARRAGKKHREQGCGRRIEIVHYVVHHPEKAHVLESW